MIKQFIFAGLLLAGAFLIEQCSTGKSTATSTSKNNTDEALLAKAKDSWSDCTLEQLQSGKNIYATKCTACHGMKSISNRSEEEWKGAITSMAPKAQLSPDETLNLTRYLLSARQLK